jgi:hypothetical protein
LLIRGFVYLIKQHSILKKVYWLFGKTTTEIRKEAQRFTKSYKAYLWICLFDNEACIGQALKGLNKNSPGQRPGYLYGMAALAL